MVEHKPEALARAINEAYVAVLDEQGEGSTPWDELPEEHRRALVEALRRVVCVRASTTIR